MSSGRLGRGWRETPRDNPSDTGRHRWQLLLVSIFVFALIFCWAKWPSSRSDLSPVVALEPDIQAPTSNSAASVSASSADNCDVSQLSPEALYLRMHMPNAPNAPYETQRSEVEVLGSGDPVLVRDLVGSWSGAMCIYNHADMRVYMAETDMRWNAASWAHSDHFSGWLYIECKDDECRKNAAGVLPVSSEYSSTSLRVQFIRCLVTLDKNRFSLDHFTLVTRNGKLLEQFAIDDQNGDQIPLPGMEEIAP